MALHTKRTDFIKTLSFSKMKKKENIGETHISIKVDKNLHIEKLFNVLQKRYSLEQKSEGEYLKMEVKKQYY